MSVRKLLFLLFAIVPFVSFSQEKDTLIMKGDSVFYGKSYQFRAIITKSKTNSYLVVVKSDNDSAQVIMRIFPKDTIAMFIAKFPQLKCFYQCRYPNIEPAVILDSYIKNKVMVKGIADMKGLQAYCNERKIEIETEETLKKKREQRTHERDSLLTVRAKERLTHQYDLMLKNKSENNIQIFLGDTTASKISLKKPGMPAFRQGRYDEIKAGEEKKFTAFDDEFICITDSLHTIYDFKKLDKKILKVVIDKKGKHFE